jgi:putative transposase
VTKTATVSLLGNRYSVDPSLVGRRVELRYDPADMSVIAIWCDGLSAGQATPFVLRQHTHPAVPQAARPVVPPTGIDYLGMVLDAHNDATTHVIKYRDLDHNVNPEEGEAS